MELTKKGICPEDIITKNVILNAIMLDMAIAGSTNAVLHLLAYGKELGFDLSLDDFGEIANEIKCIVGIIPSGPYSVVDLYEAGGVPGVMKRLEGNLYTEERMVTGITWGKYLANVFVPENSIIQTLINPVMDTAGLRILKGNLSPKGAVCRPTGFPKNMWKFSGPARVFDIEEKAAQAIMNDEIKAGDFIVIRYEGCKGSPGMNELMKATDSLIAKGLQDKVALVSDGRFSGFNHGSIIGHVSPEAFQGGIIAFVEDGDIIRYDLQEGTIQLEVSDAVLKVRKQCWTQPEPKIKKGVLAIYGALCSPAEEGGAIQNW